LVHLYYFVKDIFNYCLPLMINTRLCYKDPMCNEVYGTYPLQKMQSFNGEESFTYTESIICYCRTTCWRADDIVSA